MPFEAPAAAGYRAIRGTPGSRATDLGALADQEMAAAGDHAQRRAQPPRVLDPVVERHPVVLAPQRQRPGTHPVEVASGSATSSAPRPGGCRCGAPGRRGTPRPSRDRARPGRRPPTSRRRPPPEPRVRPGVAGGAMRRPGWTSPSTSRVTRPAGSRRRCPPPRRGRCRSCVGAPDGGAQRDEPAERMADPHGAGASPPPSATARTASAKGSRCPAPREAAPSRPWPGRSGTRTRCAAASAGARAASSR